METSLRICFKIKGRLESVSNINIVTETISDINIVTESITAHESGVEERIGKQVYTWKFKVYDHRAEDVQGAVLLSPPSLNIVLMLHS